MASVTTLIKDDYIRKDGKCQVYLQIILMRKKITINTGILVVPEKWDYEKRIIKGNSREVKDMNLIIEQARARVNDILVKYRLMERNLTPALLKSEYKNPANYSDFFEWLTNEIEGRRGMVAHQTIKSHRSTLYSLQKFRKRLAFSEIDDGFVENFEKFLRLKMKNNKNTVNKKMVILKGYLNRAIKKNIIRENPLNDMKLRRGPGTIDYLNDEELAGLIKMYVETDNKKYRKVLSYFLFACFTGLRISDVRRLRHENIINDIIVLIPQKTLNTKGEALKIPLNRAAMKLIKAQGAERVAGRVFEMYSDQKTNQYLKEVGKKAGIEKKIHFHLARHTFATLFLEKTSDLATLQQLLGHSSITQTMIYAHVSEAKKREQVRVFDDYYQTL